MLHVDLTKNIKDQDLNPEELHRSVSMDDHAAVYLLDVQIGSCLLTCQPQLLIR